ncbi:hypothetical protein PVK06_031042 [Gossypium arboreum]|uniref:Uncharacterized protein n=1 Tax=Gossypium arboreum TaxID=29729 RepID=A0ABR0NPX7_GOSAR|nr:hypothetical protein PVK06_031042 [Gossypium arboreum]
MDTELAQLRLNEEEEEILQLQIDPGSDRGDEEFQVVGCFLTASVIHFPAMRNTMANLWHPVYGVQIQDLGTKRGVANSDWIAEFPEEIEVVARSYFQKLFSKEIRGNYDHLLMGIDRCITEEDNHRLTAPYSREGIREAVFDMGLTKAPREDGFLAIFYKKCWHFIGEDVTLFCLNLLNGEMEVFSNVSRLAGIGHSWIPGIEKPEGQNNSNNELIVVSDLIDSSNRKWRTDMIMNTFQTGVAQKILQIPLTETDREDFQIGKLNCSKTCEDYARKKRDCVPDERRLERPRECFRGTMGTTARLNETW